MCVCVGGGGGGVEGGSISQLPMVEAFSFRKANAVIIQHGPLLTQVMEQTRIFSVEGAIVVSKWSIAFITSL